MRRTNKILLKGNEAVVYGALLAGCECYYGYPITPASEIAEASARLFPKLGRTFIQAECEIASINMLYGAAAAGCRAMTASSGLGISLKQEGVSYIAGADLPAVIIDVMRGGPGLGNIGPEQADYNQIVKGGGHGGYRCIVLAPGSVQEMCDFTMLAFDLADEYRTPVYVLSDGLIGQMMEKLELPEPRTRRERQDWSLKYDPQKRSNFISSIYMDPVDLEQHNIRLNAKYDRIRAKEQRAEEYLMDDAEYVFVAYGISSRMSRSAIDELRREGVRAGMVRPQTLFPFPVDVLRKYVEQAKAFLTVEMSNGQMIDDVRLAIECRRPVHLINRMGGMVASVEEIVSRAKAVIGGYEK